MSWTPDLTIGELRPWPDSVYVVRGKSDESRRYVPEDFSAMSRENVELRELVRDWRDLAVGGADSLTDWNHEQADLEQRTRELGIEVDA